MTELWKEAALAFAGLWIAGLSFYLRGLADKATVRTLKEALESHQSDDLRRFGEVLTRLDTMARDAKDDRHAFRNDITAAFTAQQKLNLEFQRQISERVADVRRAD